MNKGQYYTHTEERVGAIIIRAYASKTGKVIAMTTYDPESYTACRTAKLYIQREAERWAENNPE